MIYCNYHIYDSKQRPLYVSAGYVLAYYSSCETLSHRYRRQRNLLFSVFVSAPHAHAFCVPRVYQIVCMFYHRYHKCMSVFHWPESDHVWTLCVVGRCYRNGKFHYNLHIASQISSYILDLFHFSSTITKYIILKMAYHDSSNTILCNNICSLFLRFTRRKSLPV